jgi:hypothetical protein
MDIHAILSPLLAGPVGAIAGAAAWHYLKPIIVAEEQKFPSQVLGLVAEQWARTVASGKIDDKTRRLASKMAAAAFEWANAEMPDALGDERMDAVIKVLSELPGIGLVVANHSQEVRSLLQMEFYAWKQAIAAKDTPPPVA